MALGYVEAAVVGLLQGVSELFPVSSVGHSVLLPALIGGHWARDLNVADQESPYLAFVVGTHVATALALLWWYRRDWVRVVRGLLTSLRDRRVETPEQKLAWLLVLATIPVGVVGLVFEHSLRTRFGTPSSAAVFLTLNGVLLGAVELLRRRSARRDEELSTAGRLQGMVPISAGGTGVATRAEEEAIAADSDRRLARLGWVEGTGIGAAQIGALFAGISRSGATMAAGLVRGLSHEDAARFAFLLATPVILAAGVLKLGDVTDPALNDHGHLYGPFVLGAVLSGLAAYVSVRFLVRFFETRTLTPFAVYCLVAGAFCMVRFTF